MWREDFNEQKSRVQCLVYGHVEIRKIVFGGPFLERRKHYPGSANDVNVEER